MKQHSHTKPHSLQVSHTKFTQKKQSYDILIHDILKKAKFVGFTGLNGSNGTYYDRLLPPHVHLGPSSHGVL